MTWLLSKLVGFLIPVGAIALAAALLWGGVQTHRLKVSKAETAEVHTAWALDKANATTAALAAQTAYRAKEQAWQARVTTAEESYATLQAEHAKAIVAQRAVLADNGRMRDTIAAYARGGGAASDTVAAASDRAAALGVLLAEALRADGESANDAESNADAVRTVLAAWPHEDATISLPAMKLGQ